MNHEQPPLPFGDGRPQVGHNHPATSHNAAARITPTIHSAQLCTILALLAEAPHTDDELLTLSGMQANSARPRRIYLTRLALVEDSGAVVLNHRGNECTLWQITSKGRDALKAATK